MKQHTKDNLYLSLGAAILILTLALFDLFGIGKLNTIRKAARENINNSEAQTQPAQEPKKIFDESFLQSGFVPVLMYHHVGPLPAGSDRLRADLTVSPADFESEVKYLEQNGYHTISTQDLYLALTAKKQLPSKPIIFTFDDGYDDVFQYAVPILEQHHFIGAFGVISGFAGAPGYASWDQITAAQSQGMEIVDHSFSHIDVLMKKYTDQDRQLQVATSQSDLQSHGIRTKTYIYPYGHFNAYLEQQLKNYGFTVAFTTKFGIVSKSEANLLELPRVRVHGRESFQRFQNSLELQPVPKHSDAVKS